MCASFFKKRGVRLRETILKRVYEDNLCIIGKKGDAALATPSSFYMKKVFASVFLTIVVFFSFQNFSMAPSFNEMRMIDNARIPAPGFPQMTKTPNPPAFLYNTFLPDARTDLSRAFGLSVKTIMIDPGHGGEDAGAVGKSGTREKDITLQIARRLKTLLERRGPLRVIMTREEDTTLPLNKRVEMARDFRADLFVSIHLNYIPLRPINIIETYYFGPSSDAAILSLARQENAGSRHGLSDFREIVWKLGNALKLQESMKLASSIQNNLFLNARKDNSDIRNHGVKRAPFVVLLGVEVPAVLAEVSCLSNREEEMKMNTDSHREKVATYLEAGILDYINKGEIRHEAGRAEK